MLAALIEKEATVPDSYPLSLNALRLACNQATNRFPVVAFEDRTVEAALMSLKSIGLVRFVLPSHGGRTIRYRHVADERWRLSPAELAVLATLALRGPQTAAEVKSRAERMHRFTSPAEVDEVLDTLAGRSPDALAVRLERRPGERDQRWADLLTGEAPQVSAPPSPAQMPAPSPVPSIAPVPGMPEPDVAQLAADVADLAADVAELAADVDELRARLDRLERLLGVDTDGP